MTRRALSISPYPVVSCTELGADDAGFLLLACDGVFDVFSNEEAVNIIQHSYQERSAAEARAMGRD